MVYLVDDDEDDLELVQGALIRYSYKGPVLSLTNGRMLMDQLNGADSSAEPAVIVLDLNMPLMNGFQALAEIRKHPRHRSVQVIILTASSNKADETKCFDLGCNFFLTKPVKSDDYAILTSLVKKIIRPVDTRQE